MSNSVETAIKPYIGDREVAGQNKNLANWLKWYKGYDPSFHELKLYTGSKEFLFRRKKHLPASKIVCESWASLLFNEKTEIKMSDKDKKILDNIFLKSNLWFKGNKLIEKTFALGLGAFEVSVNDIEIDENGNITSLDKSSVKISCINATKIVPITIEDDVITECAFATSNTQNSYITIHLKNDAGNYEITTLEYEDKDFKTLSGTKTFDTKSNVAWFSCISPAICDNEDIDNSIGISIFANHIDQMKAIDTKYDLFDNEFAKGRKRTYISSKMQQFNEDGDLIKTFEGTEDDVFIIPQGDDGHNLIQNDTSDLRTNQCVEALNSELSMFGYLCGFGKGFLTFNTEASGRPIQTATASMMQNNDLFRSIHKHEIVLEQSLTNLVEAIIYANNTYTNNDKFSNTAVKEIEIKFDDSIFEDKEAEKNTARTDIQNGILTELEYRVKFYGETEEEAKQKLASNSNYVAKQLNALLPALQSRAISVKEFVKLIWFNENSELEKYIEEGLSSGTGISAEELMASGFGSQP